MIKLHMTIGIRGDKPEVLYCGTDGNANVAAYRAASVAVDEKDAFDAVLLLKRPDWDKRKRKPARAPQSPEEQRAARAALDAAVAERNAIDERERKERAAAQEADNRAAAEAANARNRAQIDRERAARRDADARVAAEKARATAGPAPKVKPAKGKREKLNPAD